MIVYLRVLPGFCIAVEERQRPEIRSYPVIVGGLPHQRGLVHEVNSSAARCGVRAGLTLAQARHYCPDGIFLLPDHMRYEALWEEMCDILRRYTPLVEPVALGQAACDLSGCERRWDNSSNAAHEITQQIRRQMGLTPFLGVASNWLVAQLASTAPGSDAVTVVEPGQERAFLAPLPLTLLPEVDTRLALTFNVLGLRTIGQLAALPAAAVEQRFGPAGKKLHRYARGIDRRPVSPPPPRPAVTARYECEDGSPEEALAALQRLAETCADELQHRHLMGKLVTLKLIWQTHDSQPVEPEVQPHPDSQLTEPEVQPLPAAAALPASAPSLPIGYRIHSMLPQPGRAPLLPPPPSVEEKKRGTGLQPAALLQPAVLLRTPIDAAPPLLEHAQRLLLQLWPASNSCETNPLCLQALELEVSEFEPPRQMAFTELMRLDQTGTLGGGVADPRGILARQGRILATRYGQQPFQHAAQLDPDSILTERRFRWENGLPWDSPFPSIPLYYGLSRTAMSNTSRPTRKPS